MGNSKVFAPSVRLVEPRVVAIRQHVGSNVTVRYIDDSSVRSETVTATLTSVSMNAVKLRGSAPLVFDRSNGPAAEQSGKGIISIYLASNGRQLFHSRQMLARLEEAQRIKTLEDAGRLRSTFGKDVTVISRSTRRL